MNRWLFFMIIPIVVCSPLGAARIEHSVSFNTPTLTEWHIGQQGNSPPVTYTKINMPDSPLMANPGEPQVPFRPVTLLLPQNEILQNVAVIFDGWYDLPGTVTLAPGQHCYPLSEPQALQITAPDPVIYRSDSPFPSVDCSEPRIFWSKGYQLVTFNVFPVRYVPSQGTLRAARNAHIIIDTAVADTRSDRVRCRGLVSDLDWITGKVENPELASCYKAEPVQTQSLLSRDVYQYVIISNNTLINTPGPNNFQDLLAFKSTRGISGTIKPIEDIYAEYTGVDNQDKIRNFCMDAYENWNTEYILLGGDQAIVPTRGCYATAEGHEDNTVPTDMYFGCLDGNWNSNGNSRYGEVDDGPGGTEPDVLAELFIGRGSVDSATQLRNFVAKIIAYETDDYQADWADNALLLGEYLWPQTYGGDYMDELWYGSDLWGYSTPGYPSGWAIDHLYERETSWSSSQLVPKMNSNNVHWINHLGHANETTVMLLSISNVQSLTNSRPFLVYSQGCYAGAFDTTDCIAENFSWNAGGAFAVFMNGRYGWGEIGCTDGPGQYFHRQFHDAFFTEDIRELGRMNADSKEDNIWCMNYKANRWTCYEVNLLGCPQTPLFGRVTTRGQFNFDQPAYASDGTVVCTVQDVDLNIDPYTADSISIVLTVDNGDSETLLLTETGPNTGVFQESIDIRDSAAAPGNGYIDASPDDVITGTYIDASTGFGGVNIPVTDTAVVDDTYPVISNVTIAFHDDTSATITWTTDEPCTGTVIYGLSTPDTETSVEGLRTSHSVTITGLQQCMDYVLFVRSADGAGNTTEDDNGGLNYAFTTMVRIYVLQENMDTNPNWTISGGDWQFGQPTGQPSGPGADPTSGFDGPNVYGTNLNGAYAGGSTPYHLTTPALDCSAAFGVRFSFYQWLDVDEHGYDEAYILVSNDGNTWHTIYTNPNSNLYDYAWTRYEYDISEYADGQPAVYIRWTMGPASTGSVGGWNIDNVEISYAAPCNVPILLHHSHEIDDSAGNGDGMINPLETIAMLVTLRNVGLDAMGVSAVLSTDYTGVTVTVPSANFPNILQGGNGTSLTDYQFSVNDTAIDGDTVPFVVEWTAGGTTAQTMFMEEIVAANACFDSCGIIDWNTRGDGDGIFDPGETVQMTVSLINQGRLAAQDITGTLTCNHPEYITIDQGWAGFPDMNPGQTVSSIDPHFTVSSLQSTPDHMIVTFYLEIEAYAHHKILPFDVEITTSTFVRRQLWDMDDNPGWTTEGQWAWGIPQGAGGDPSSGFSGANVYGYNLAGAYANDMSETSLTSTPINCANLSDVEVRFMRWLGVESSSYDHASFRVSNNGSTWTTIWDHTGSSFTDPSWQAMSYDISGIADGQAAVYLRWVMGTTDGSVVYCGWNLDDIELWASSDNPQVVLTHADHAIDDSAGNNDGMINPMETILLDVTVENVGIAGTGITGYLSTTNPHVTVTQDSALFPDIPAGGQGQTLTPFAFDVSAAATNGETISFTVTYFSSAGNGSFTFTETVAGPDLSIGTITITDGGDHDGILDPGETATLAIELLNGGSMGITGVTGTINSDSPAYLFINDDEADFNDIVGGGSGGSITPHFSIQAAGFTPDPTVVTVTLDIQSNEAEAELTFEIEITGSNFIQRYYWNMDTNPGWTTESQWAWGVPQGASGDPSSGYTGTSVYGYNLSGSYTNSMPETNLTTTAIDCSSLENVEVRFMRWLGVESSTWDHASFRVSNNGTSWTTIWDHSGSSFTDTSWQTMVYDISAVADNQPTVYLRWVMGTTDSSVVYCGWNVDDVEVWADSFGNPCVHHGDCNFDGEITAGDAQMAFMCALGVITPTEEEACAADCNANGEITAGDAQQIFMTALGMTSCADPMDRVKDAPPRLSHLPIVNHEIPVSLDYVEADQNTIEIAITLDTDHREIDAFWIELSLDSRFTLVECFTGDLNPQWVQFGCNDPAPDRIRIGAYNDGTYDPVIPEGVGGTLATLVITGPVETAIRDQLVPVRILRVADDIKP
ncbi:hypothetical protein JW823_00620 [bacterium]|nr:hypothetical protein [candidate division CSSED10-310 bacterium]